MNLPARTSLAFILLLLPAWGTFAASPDPAQTKAKEAELERLRDSIQTLSNDLGNLRDQRDKERNNLRDLDRKIGGLNRNLRDLEQERRKQTDNLAGLQNARKIKQTEIGAEREALARQVRNAYFLSRQDPLKLLFTPTEPAALTRSLRYYDYFYRGHAEQIAALNNTLSTLTTLEQDIQHRQQDLQALYDRQRNQRQQLDAARQERNTALAELKHDIHTTEQRLSQLREDEQTLKELVQRLRRALAELPPPESGKPFAQLKGHLPLPAAGTLTAHFGAPRQLGELKWQGIVIDTAAGAAVSAIAAGRVVFADWLRGFGMLLILDHGDGYMSLYGYNQSLYKNVGDMVKGGEIIAEVGNSGGRDQPGLYFEIRHQGTPLNPLQWCKTDTGR